MEVFVVETPLIPQNDIVLGKWLEGMGREDCSSLPTKIFERE
jgi:hypothetical protein